jgi:hypothetical protein
MTVANWRYGHPWFNPQYANPQAYGYSTPAYASLTGGGGQTGGVSGETAGQPDFGAGPDVAGPMTSDEKSRFGAIMGSPVDIAAQFGYDMPGALADVTGMSPENASRAIGVAGGLAKTGLGALTGVSAPTGLMRGFVSLFDAPAIRSLLGWGNQRVTMAPSMADRQAAADKYGYGIFGAPTDVVGGVSVGPSGYGTTGPSGIMGTGMANPDSPFGQATEGTGGGGPGSGGMDTGMGGFGGGPGTGSDPGGTGEGDTDYKRGGVKTFRKPTRPLVGEGGEDEKGIFIPSRMKRKGLQGNERQVRRGLYSSLMDLTGRGTR